MEKSVSPQNDKTMSYGKNVAEKGAMDVFQLLSTASEKQFWIFSFQMKI